MKLREGGALSVPPSLNFIVGLSSARLFIGGSTLWNLAAQMPENTDSSETLHYD